MATPFVKDEYYHVYNRGVEKRNIFLDSYDLNRFVVSLKEFNRLEPVGSLRDICDKKQLPHSSPTTEEKIIELVAFCLNPNHFHLIIKPITESGGAEYIQRLVGGYTRYFNEKYQRSGVLFQGKTKRKNIFNDEYLMYCGVYVNLNYKVHKLENHPLKCSSLDFYGKPYCFCDFDVLIQNYGGIKHYKDECKKLLPHLIAQKQQIKELSETLIE